MQFSLALSWLQHQVNSFFSPTQALARFQNSHKVTTKSGLETEESLLHESAARETSLNSQILDLEADAKHLRLELERVTAEREQLLQQVHFFVSLFFNILSCICNFR